MSIYDMFKNGSKAFNKEEWAAEKQAERKGAYELADTMCDKMMKSSDLFQKYLEVQGRFDLYSVTNAVLVTAQMPEATQLKDYKNWKQNRVYLDKNAQKVMILEPGKEYLRDDGTTAVSYNAKAVYDISQTTAKDRVNEVEPKSMRELVAALIDVAPVSFEPTSDLETPAFYDKEQGTIFIKTGLQEEQLFVSMAKEVAAAIYDFKHGKSREESEFKSFCVAYMVGSKYGLDNQGFNFENLTQEFDGMETQAFKEELGSMRDVLKEVTSEMYKSMEKNKPEKTKEQER
jgi:hypothetical protein